MEEEIKKYFYIFRIKDNRYQTYQEEKPEGSNYTEMEPPQFDAEKEFPYWNARKEKWDIIPNE